MLKKIISIGLCAIMLFCTIVPVFAASIDNEQSEYATVEDILNNYHVRSFEERLAQENDNATTYDLRSISEESLEEQTVAELNAAGYESYHVTPDNYYILQDSLKTDFTELGLEPDGSYIITISGDPSANSRSIDPPLEDYYEGGGSIFTYIYNDTTYFMRSVTITPTTNSGLKVDSTYNLSNIDDIPEYVGEFTSTALSTVVDTLAIVPIATIVSLIGTMATDSNYTIVDPGALTIHASTAWTRLFIQVLDSNNYWRNAQCSEYAISSARCAGFLYDIRTHSPVWNEGDVYSSTRYSKYYANADQRKFYAVTGFFAGTICYDITGSINFYFRKDTGEINFNQNTDPLFVHPEPATGY